MKKQYATRLAGQELSLEIQDDRFVSRVPRATLEKQGFRVAEQLSTRSFAVLARPGNLEHQMATARGLGGAAYPYYRVADTQSDFLISDRVFVRFRGTLSKEQVIAFAQDYDGEPVTRYGEEVLIQLPIGADPLDMVKKMSDDPIVALAEHDLNHQVETLELTLPTDPAYAYQWHLHGNLPGNAPDATPQPRISAAVQGAWELLGNFGSRDVVIGLTDGGVDLRNSDFPSPNSMEFEEKFAGWGYFRGRWIRTNRSSRSLISEMAEAPRHGTAMAALIGASVNDGVAVGVAPGCRLLPISFEKADGRLLVATSRVRTAFRFLSNRADVISNSWGVGERSLWGRLFLEEIAHLAINGGRRRKGLVFVWAAGNSNCPIANNFIAEEAIPIDNGRDGIGQFVGPEKAREFRNDLVGLPGTIHVAAVGSTGHRSHYSNYGPGIRLCAPSDNQHLYGLEGVVPESLPITSSPSASVLQTPPGGTSTAAAIVAGVAGLVISANPELTSSQVVSILQQTANKKLDPTPYPKTHPIDVSPILPFEDGRFTDIGHGDGSWSPWFGFGAVDARAAVAAALQTVETKSDPQAVAAT
jgi:subtilisin family serine protease